jgi:hypothetical protein
MYLKSLAILEKASISLRKYSKIVEIFIKARLEKVGSLYISGNVFEKPRYVYKILIFIIKKPPLLAF